MNATAKTVHPTRSPNREANERFVHIHLPDLTEFENGRRVKALTVFIRNVDGTDYAAFAEVDERDQFCRRRGRVVARRKFFNGKRVPLVAPAVDLSVIDVSKLARGYETGPMSLYDRCLTTWINS